MSKFLTRDEAHEALIGLGLPPLEDWKALGQSADLSFWYRQLATILVNRDKELRGLCAPGRTIWAWQLQDLLQEWGSRG